jgi:hypothetical protein
MSVVSGGQSRKRKAKESPSQNNLANRWRQGESAPPQREAARGDVIPLLDGWVRRLERQAGLDSAANER